MFNIDFQKIWYNLIPHFLRAEKMLAFGNSLVKPLKQLNQTFNVFRNNINYKLQFTSQIIYLEHYLNDQFDQLNRAIFITNIEEDDFTFVFNAIELKPALYFYNKAEAQPDYYLYNWQELLEGDNYVVNVPSSVVYNEQNMRAKINFYNQAGKNYSIITF